MARINVRDIEESVKDRLRLRAARHGRSLEEEVRTILRQAAGGTTGPALLASMEWHFGPDNGVVLETGSRSTRRGVAEFQDDDGQTE